MSENEALPNGWQLIVGLEVHVAGAALAGDIQRVIDKGHHGRRA